MDTAQIDTIITFLAAVAHALEYAGAATFLIVAGYCALMHALALFFVVLRALLEFARRCTSHMVNDLRGLIEEVGAWSRSIESAFRSSSLNSDSKVGTHDRGD
jgi:hypothetical protein